MNNIFRDCFFIVTYLQGLLFFGLWIFRDCVLTVNYIRGLFFLLGTARYYNQYLHIYFKHSASLELLEWLCGWLVWIWSSNWLNIGILDVEINCSAKPNSSISLLVIWADTAFWLCTAVQISGRDWQSLLRAGRNLSCLMISHEVKTCLPNFY